MTATSLPTAVGPLGYSLPLSPSGTSAMITPPPWHFSGDVIMIDYRVDPDAAARFLPPGLDLGPDPGAAAAVFAEWQWCSESGAELADPGTCQFAEFLLLIGCSYVGKPMARCPYAWVDQPVPMVRGWIQGMPKQFGAIHQTRPKPVGVAGQRPAPGERMHGTLSVSGRRVAEAAVKLTGLAEQPPALHTVPLVHTRYFPAWAPGGEPVRELVTSEVNGVEFTPVWQGEAELNLFDVLDSDFAALAPVEVGAGYVFSYAETLLGGRVLGQTPDPGR